MRHTVSERRKRWFFVRSLFKSFWEHLDKRQTRRRSAAKSRPLFAEALEPRVMFSASPVPVEQEQEPVDEAPVAQEAKLPDVPLEVTPVVTIQGGNLVFNRMDDVADTLDVRVDGSNLVLHDSNQVLTSDVGSGSGTNTITVALSDFRDLVINTRGGTDQISIEALEGFSGSVTVDAGDGTDTVTLASSLSVAGISVTGEAIHLKGGTYTTTGDQTYSGAVYLGANTTINGRNVLFNGTVDSETRGAGTGTGGALVVAVGTTTTINTSTGEINGVVSAGWDGSAFNFTDIEISGTLTATGSNPLRLNATRTVSVTGLIDADGGDGGSYQYSSNINSFLSGGAGGLAGPGGNAGGAGGAFSYGSSYNGSNASGNGAGAGGANGGQYRSGSGGGGGNLNQGGGGSGYNSGTGGTGGSAFSSLDPLKGGGGGGGGTAGYGYWYDSWGGNYAYYDVSSGAGGGGGGGAVSISAGRIEVSGTIDASGGNGSSGYYGGGGGGGAGGTIRLEGYTSGITGSLNVAGGSGGSGYGSNGGAGSSGRTELLQGDAFSLTVNSSDGGTTSFLGEVGGSTPLISLATNADGTTELGGDVSLSGATSTFNDAVVLTGDVEIDHGGAGGVTFGSTIDSSAGQSHDLSVKSASGSIQLNGNVGADGLGVLSLDGAVTTNLSDLTLQAEDLDLKGSLNVGGGTLRLKSGAGATIGLGTDVADFSLSEAGAAAITAGILEIGDSNAGSIVAGDADFSGVSTVVLRTGGSVSEAGISDDTADIKAGARLAIFAATGVNVDVEASTLAVANSGMGGIDLTAFGDTTIGTVALADGLSLSGVSTAGGNVSLAAVGGSSTNGTLLGTADLTALENWLGEGALNLTTLFTKTSGATGANFHAAADGQGRTFTVLEVSSSYGTQLIGGYNPKSWTSNGGYNNDGSLNAFLFNLSTGVKLDQTDSYYQTFDNNGYGPVFGGGFDLYVNYNLDSGQAYTYSYNHAGVNVFGSNGTNFTITAMEVYTISPTASSGQLLIDAQVSAVGGTVTLTADQVTLQDDAALTPQVRGTSDFDGIVINGALTLEAGAELNPTLGGVYTPALNDEIILIANDGTDPISGTLTQGGIALAEGDEVSVGGQLFTISYLGGDGNDVTLTSATVSTTEIVVDGNGDLTITDTEGGDTNDDLTLTVHGGNFLITDTGNGVSQSIAVNSVTGDIVINGSDGDDTFTIDLNGGDITKNIVYNGGVGGFDTLRIIGTGGEVVTYNPDTLTYGNGVIDLGNGHTITFTGLEPVDVVGVGTFNLVLAGANDIIDISNGLTGGGDAALILSGTSGGVAFELANVRNVGNVVINTTAVDGDDAITITSANNLHGNGNLQIITGDTGTDSVTISGPVTFAGGDIEIQTRVLNLNGLVTAANATFRPQIASTMRVGAAGAATMVITDTQITNNLALSGTLTVGRADGTGTLTLSSLDIEAQGFDFAAVNGGQINLTGALATGGEVSISANQNNSGANDFDMSTVSSSISTTSGSASAVTINVGTTAGASTTTLRDISVAPGGGITVTTLGSSTIDLVAGTLNATVGGTVTLTSAGAIDIDGNIEAGEITLDAGTSATVDGEFIGESGVTITSLGSVTINGPIDAGSGTINIDANTDGGGAEGLTVATTATLQTTDTTLSAITIDAGTGSDISLGGTLITGDGGRISATAGDDLTITTGSVDVGPTGSIVLSAADAISTATSSTFTIQAAAELEINANTNAAGAETFTMAASSAIAAGTTGAALIDINISSSSGSATLGNITTALDGSIDVFASGTGSLSTIAGTTLSAPGTGQIKIEGQGDINVNGTVDAGSGLIDIDANSDNDGSTQRFAMGVDGKLTTTSTAANSVDIRTGSSSGNTTIREIATSGGVVIDMNGSGGLFTNNATTSGLGIVADGNVSLNSENSMTLNGDIDAGSGTITIEANSDGAGNEGLSISGGSDFLTTNTTASAIMVRANVGAGLTTDEGDVTITTVGGSFTTGNGGQVTITTVSGSAGNAASMTFGSGATGESVTFDVGVDGLVLLESEDNITIQRGTTLTLNGGGRMVINANTDDLGNNSFIMVANATFGDAAIVSDSTHADAITINVGTTIGTSDLADITTGAGGGISVTQTGGDIVVLDRGVIAAPGSGSVQISNTGSVTINGTIDAGSGLIDIDANTDNDGSAEDFDMGVDGKLTTTSTAANSVSLTIGNSTGTSTFREIATSGGVLIDANGDATALLFTNATTSGLGVVATGAGNISIDSEGSITMSGTIDAGSGTIDVYANSDETGAQSISITDAAALTTTNATASAIRVRVNAPGGGSLDEGDIVINTVGGTFTTGDGGRVSLSTVSGSAEADPANLTFGDGTTGRSVTFNVGSTGDVLIESEDTITIQRGTTLNVVGGGRISFQANTDGAGAGVLSMITSATFGDAAIVSDSAHADAISVTVGSTTGDSILGDITLSNGGGLVATQTGGQLLVDARGVINAVGAGAVQLSGSGSVTINGTVNAGSGLIVIAANTDNDGSLDDFDMGADGALTTTSTAANSVSITTGNSTGGSTVREIVTSGGIVIEGEGDAHSFTFNNGATSGTGLVANGSGNISLSDEGGITLNGTIDAGSGTIDIRANIDGTGSQSVTMASTANLTTTNAGASAIQVRANDALAGTGTGDVVIGGALTAGAGGTITLSTASLDGGGVANITINDATVNAGATGAIVIESNDAVTVATSQTLTVAGGSNLTIEANQDGVSTQGFTMNAGSAIDSDSTNADAVAITVNLPGSGAGASSIGDVSVGSGGGIAITNHGAAVSTQVGTSLTATNGMIDLKGTNLALAGQASAVGGTVTIDRSIAGTIGVYGVTAFGDLQISQTELNNISAATLNIGDANATDNNASLIRVNAATTTAGVTGTTRFNALDVAGADVQFLGANSFNAVEANANNLIDLQGTTSVTTQTGGATFNADADSSGAGNFQTAAGSSVNTATPGALISVTAVDAAINATSSLNAGNGNILLRPVSNASTIGIGGGTGDFNLSDAELATLASNGTVTIGRAGTGTGAVDMDAVNLGGGNYDLAVHGGSIAVEGLDLADQDVSLTATTGSITDGGGTTDITGNAVTLSAVNGSLGAAGAGALDLQAASLSTNTSTGGGAQFLNDVDNVNVTSALAGSGTLTLNGGEFDLTNGAVGDASSIVVESGATLDANGAVDTLSSITVQSGGSLKGGGTLTAPVTIEAGGTLTPGQSPGLLATTDLVVDGAYIVEMDGPAGAGAVNGHDQTAVTGSVTLNGATSTLTVDVTDVTLGEFTGGTERVIISNDGVDAVSGTFSNFGEATIVHSNFDGTLDMVLTYQGGDGNDVALRIGNLTTRVFVDGSGNLVIEDINEVTADQLTLQVVGSNLVISEANTGILIDAQGTVDGTTGDLTNQVTVALSSFTGNVILRTGDGNDSVIFQNMDLTGTQGITVEDGAGTDTVTFSGSASNLANGNVSVTAQTITVNSALDAGTAGNVALNASGGNLAINANVSTGGAGAIDLDATGTITQLDGSTISSGSGPITLDAAGNLTIAAIVTTGSVSATSTAGAILDGGDSAVDVTASSFAASAATGIGSANFLETAVSNLEARSGTGTLRIQNTGALTVGGVTGALTGLASSDRNIEVVSTGDLTINESITAGGSNITLTTDGIAINAAITSPAGVLTIAPRTASTTIGIGGGAGTLNLDDAELANLTNGFIDVVIGDAAAGTGAVDIDSSLFQDRLTIVGGSISVTELNNGTRTVTLTARTGAITQGGNVGTDITAGTLDLNAAGSIGASGAGEPIALNASTLRTNSTLGGANGNQFFSDTANVNIGASFNAGTGTATLTESGEFRLVDNAIADLTTLVVENGASLNLNGSTDTLAAVIINDGGIVYGQGTLNAAVTVNDGGLITPGTNTGATGPRIISTGALTLEEGGIYHVELDGVAGPGVNGGNDQLLASGAVTINNATLQLEILPALYNSTAGETFVIINNSGGSPVSGTFFGLAEGTFVSVPTSLDLPDEIFQISYTGGDGNDVVLIATGQTATTNIRIDGSGNLVIDDILGAATNDNLSISRSGGSFIIEDLSNNPLGTLIVGATHSAINRISIPETLVTGGVIVNTLAGDDTITIGNLGTLDGVLTVNGGTGIDSITQSTNATVTLTGANGATYTAERISMLGGGAITTDSGNITLLGNATGVAAGNFKGITAFGVDLTSTSGNITLTGQGGNTGINNYGIHIGTDSVGGTSNITTGGTGTITISGTGRGAAAFGGQFGVLLTGTAVEATGSGAVSISGRGGSSLKVADGLTIEKGSSIEVNTGNLTLTGTGGTGSSGARGISIAAAATIRSNGGSNILIQGTAGNADSSEGVLVSDGDISTSGAGTLTIRGTGGGGLKGGSPGVTIAKGSVLETADGELLIQGTGSGTLGTGNDGVLIVSSSVLRSTGTGNLTIAGTGGTSASSVGISLNNVELSVSEGNLSLTGTGRALSNGRGIEIEKGVEFTSTGAGNITLLGSGNVAGTLTNNSGVVGKDASVTLTGTGGLTIRGTAGGGTTLNEGVVLSGMELSTASGDIEISGTGRGNRGEGSGVVLERGTTVSGGTTASVTIQGTGSILGIAGTRNNRGVEVSGGSSVTTIDGNLSITGTGGGNGIGTGNHGIEVLTGTVQATGGGDVTLVGTGGFGGTGIRASSATIRSGAGTLSMTGNGGGGTKGSYGIFITLSDVQANDGGAVELLGQASAVASGTLNTGVWIDRSTFGSIGTVDITGTGGGGTATNHGIYMNLITEVGSGFTTTGTAGGGAPLKSLDLAGNYFP